MNNQFSVRNSLAYLLVLLIGILAVRAYFAIGVQTYPDIALPTYTIRASAPGMMPELVEERVRAPLEQAVRELGQIENITSTSQYGSVQITLKTKENIGSDYHEKLTKKVSEAAKSLPGGAESVQVEQSRINDNEIGYFFVHGTDLQTLSDAAKYTVTEKLLGIPGVSRVETEDEAIQNKVEVLFRPSMLQAYGLTPGDVIRQLQGNSGITQLGTIGQESGDTSFQWLNEASSPQELGKTLIASDKGYVALKLLAEIRDLRGSQGDSITLYKGEPSIGIRVFSEVAGQVPKIRSEVAKAIAELNEEAGGRYRLDEFLIQHAAIGKGIGDFLLFVALASAIASAFIGVWLRQILAAVLSLIANWVAIGGLLAGLWLGGYSVNMATLGPLAVSTLLCIGAGIALFHRYSSIGEWTQASLDKETGKVLAILLLSAVVLFLLFLPVLYTDFVKTMDKPTLYDALPVFAFGTISLLLVYGFIVPTIASGWLQGRSISLQENRHGKLAGYVTKRWERLIQLRYLPYGITLTSALLFTFFFHTFVTVDPYLKLDSNQMTISLQMVKGSTVEQAVKAAKAAEEKLRKISEIRDLKTVATKTEITIQLLLQDKYDRQRKKTDYEKDIDKALREIPGTDPFDLIVGEEKATRLEFVLKGQSLQTTKELAQKVLLFLQGLPWRDNFGREFITDEKISFLDDEQNILIRPKPEMFVRYRINEDEVKSQLQSYLSEQAIGNVYWNNQSVPIAARYPEKLMEHADQVQNILIRTPQGAVRAGDLVEWQLGPSLAKYEREDGLYVIKVSSAIAEPNRIPTISVFLPLRMQQTVLIPDGYTIQSAEEIRELEKEQSEKKDMAGRAVVSAIALLLILLVAALVQRRLRYALTAVLLLPVLAGTTVLGHLVLNRPLNLMAFYGMFAVAALLIQQTFMMIYHLERERETAATLDEGVRAGTHRYLGAIAALFTSMIAASLPLAAGLGSGEDFHASFAAVWLIGMIASGWMLTVLVPGMYRAAELRVAAAAQFSVLQKKQQLQAWWDNYRVRKKEWREWEQLEKQKRLEEKVLEEGEKSERSRELSPDDFLPLSR